ncbi:MAG: hypothetical protein ABII82_10265 [Verrucomicrobiota bacterium]
MKKKTLAEFEQVHGGGKIKALQRKLDQEHAKVESLAGIQNRVRVERSKDCAIRFGLTGDRHTGSLYHHAAALAAFYEYCRSEGIGTIYDCGDILAGHRVYRGQDFEVRDLGFEAQLARLAQDAPRSIRTKFITGNHDASFKHLAGVPVGKMIAETVPEYEFLGEEQARVEWQTPHGPFRLMLVHPGGGTAYALSYKVQKIIESLEGGTKPDLLGIGHFHKAEMIPSYRNVCGVQVGTFERQTPFMARGGLSAHVGGWVIEATVGKGHNRIRGEFVAFYV